MIRVGYTNVDGSEVVHATVDNGSDADLSINALVFEKSSDKTIEYFFYSNIKMSSSTKENCHYWRWIFTCWQCSIS